MNGTNDQMQLPDGSWAPALPLGWQGAGPDFEVTRSDRGFVWEAFDEDVLIGKGTARTRIGLALALRRFKRASGRVS